MEIVVSVNDVDTFGSIPRKALGRNKIVQGNIVVGQSYDAAVDINAVPENSFIGVVGVRTIRCLFVIWSIEIAREGSFLFRYSVSLKPCISKGEGQTMF